MSHFRQRVVIRGGGEMGSGVAWRLARAGYAVIIAEIARPVAIRRWVCFAEAIADGEQTVEGVRAVRVAAPNDVAGVLSGGAIPVLVLPEPNRLSELSPDVIVDATLRKKNADHLRELAGRTIGLGPGFTAGVEVDCIVETNRGPNMGRCIWSGSAEPDTGVPGAIGGETVRRVLRAPRAGTVETIRSIGDRVRAGDAVARMGDADVVSELDGVVRGLIRPGIPVSAGQKIGDVDPRGDVELCRRVSDKALAIAGGVLEAILSEPPKGGI